MRINVLLLIDPENLGIWNFQRWKSGRSEGYMTSSHTHKKHLQTHLSLYLCPLSHSAIYSLTIIYSLKPLSDVKNKSYKIYIAFKYVFKSGYYKKSTNNITRKVFGYKEKTKAHARPHPTATQATLFEVACGK